MKLNELSPKEGSTKNRIRVGRGIGSGKGKTGGRGVKGQKSRSGVSINGFEGGQMPLYKRLPKRGFNNPFAKRYSAITLKKLQEAIDTKKIDIKKDITEDILVTSKVIRRVRHGVRLLGTGEITSKVNLKITGTTKSAQEAVEKAGGSIELIVKEVAPIKNGKVSKKGK
ncbi:MAG: 50S ribosomal protein L15 [Alphaproteobacteria bacterium]|nr:50S ribosomal protein L15 [Alphaproteobacteria bacterium]